MLNNSVTRFLEMLASKDPTPGGGGASALTGALAVALGSMVSNLTLGKKKYARYEDEIKGVLKEAERLRLELEDLAVEDALVFEPLSRAYSMASGTREEREEKTRVLEGALKEAAGVPMKILKTLNDTLTIFEVLSLKGSRIVISDVGCGAALVRGAISSSVLNVYINTKLMKDKDYAARLNREAALMAWEGIKRADEIYRNIEKSLMNP